MPSSLNAVARRRLVNQHLLSPTLREATAVVRVLGAVQSQDYGAAKWAIAQRAKGLTDVHIDQVFAGGALLRTHVLRPTWHFVLPEDARWMLELTAPRIRGAMAYYNRTLELDATVFRASHQAMERALRDGRYLTRVELSAALGRAGVDVSSGQRVGNLLMQAELDGVIISGPRRGKQFTYALFDERVPPAARRDRDDALHDLTLRYFATRGPATLQDFAWWSGLTVADAKRGVETASRSLLREALDGEPYWSAPAGPAPHRWRRVAHLLPNYDEYFIGFKDRSAFAERLGCVVTQARFDALMGHVVFVDGQIVGGWRRSLGATADVELRLLVKLSAAERSLVRRATRRFGEFLRLPVRLVHRRRSR
ncbi:MAG TPA: winged helix DNA-binding domain-containing protein [Gemmatimonadales bacterium]|nr:winged helix DNA-binding domain-containing protein [Gemmatimonadales bacterium]